MKRRDANGNQTTRNKGVANQEQVLTWDSGNRLSAVTYTNRTATGSGGGSLPTTCNGVPCKRVYFPLVMQQSPVERYSYDADGARVRKESKSEITRYVGPHFEVTVAITNSQVLTTTKQRTVSRARKTTTSAGNPSRYGKVTP